MAQADSDDSISVTSTVLSEEQSEYEVDTILAEDNSGDDTYYLVKWLGYPDERCTWEPAESFSTDETLRDWTAKKRSIADGKLPPFDTEAWRAKVEALEAQRKERKRRRQAKRRRLGLLDAGIAPGDVIPNSEASKANASTSRVTTEAGTYNKWTALESSGPGREHAQKRLNLSIPSRPRPPPPPPVLFGSSKQRPAPGPARAQRPHNPDSFKRFNLSTQWKYEKARKNEPPPNTSQVELFRPSDFPPRSGANLAALGAPGLRKPDGSGVQASPRATTVPETQARSPTRSAEAVNDNPTPQSPPTSVPALSNPPSHDSRTTVRKPNTQRDIPKRRPGPFAKRISKQPGVWWNPGEAFVFIYYGPDKEEIGAARLCGLFKPIQDKLVKSKRPTPQLSIWFQHLSTPADYQIQCDSSRNDVLSNGWVEGFDHTEPRLYRFAQELMQKNLVAISCPENRSHDAYLLYPPESRDFRFLGRHPREPLDFSLRIAVKKSTDFFDQPRPPAEAPRPRSLTQTASPDESSHPSKRPEPPRKQLSDDIRSSTAPPRSAVLPSRSDRQGLLGQQPKATHLDAPATSPEPDISTVGEPMDISDDDKQPSAVSNKNDKTTPNEPQNAREMANKAFLELFGVTYKMLAAVGGNQKSPYSIWFYIMFPKDPSAAEESQLLQGFLEANGAAVYSNAIEADWDRFLRLSHGVILVHDSHMGQFSEPWFRELVHRPSWRYSLSNTPGQANFQRLFPVGGVILITEDFMTHRPQGTLIFLTFCLDLFKGKYPGTWKIMFRPDVLNWLMTLYEKDKNRDVWLAIYSTIVQLNKSTSTALPDGISTSFCESAVISPRAIPRYGFRTEEDNPDIPKGLSQEYRNADHLIEFFAGWSLLNCHRFKRFCVLTDMPPLERWNAWRHIEAILQGDKRALSHFNVDYKHYWSKLRRQNSSGDSAQQQAHTPFEPHTPKTPSKVPSNLDGTTSADPRRRSAARNYPQPYQ